LMSRHGSVLLCTEHPAVGKPGSLAALRCASVPSRCASLIIQPQPLSTLSGIWLLRAELPSSRGARGTRHRLLPAGL
jgi:hypothetical protein